MAKSKPAVVNPSKKLTAIHMHALKSMIREDVPDDEIISQLKIDEKTLNKFKELYRNDIPDKPVDLRADKIKMIKDKVLPRLLEMGLTLSTSVNLINQNLDQQIVNYPDPDMGASYLFDKILPTINQSEAMMQKSGNGHVVTNMTSAAGLSAQARKSGEPTPTSAVSIHSNDVFTFPKKV